MFCEKNRREGGGLILLDDFNIPSVNLYLKFHHQRLFACFVVVNYNRKLYAFILYGIK